MTGNRARDFFAGSPPTELSAVNGFSGGRIDRRVEKRDAATLDAAFAHPDARLLLFRGDQALLKNGGGAYFTIAEARALDASESAMLLLGFEDGLPVLASTVPADGALDETRVKPADLRSLAVEGHVAPDALGALALGRSLTFWHMRHGFCANCGVPTKIAIGGFRRDCPSCKTEHFPRTDPVAIMLIVDGENCLLARQARFPLAFFSTLAGFVEPGETIEAAVRREVAEESAITVGRVRYYSSQPWPFPSSLMIGCHGEALSTAITRDEAELEECRWFSRDEVKTMIAGTHPDGLRVPPPMAIAHQLIKAWTEFR